MKNLLAVILGFTALALGQVTNPTAPAPKVTLARPGDVVKILPIAQKEIVNGYYSTYETLRKMYPAGSGVEMTFDSTHGTLVVRGPATAVKLVEDMVKQLDVPIAAAPPAANVEVTVHVLYASAKEDAKGIVPADLQPTVQQLKGIFSYSSYRVMDVLFMRGRDNQAMDETANVSGSSSTIYQLRYTPIIALGPKPQSVRLKGLSFSMRGTGINNVGLTTDVDVREGQRVVVGKANLSGTEDAIILVVSAKVIQ
jgi:hypothetical protein